MTEQTSQMTPVQLLETQLKYLDAIHKAQLKETIALQEQTEKLSHLIARAYDINDLIHVKIEDINMPFVALVGFLIKVALAAVPAGIIFGSVYSLVISLF